MFKNPEYQKKKLRNEGHPLLPPASTHDSNCSILKYSSTPPQFFDVIFILNRENRQTHKKEVELLNFKIFLGPLQNEKIINSLFVPF